MRGSPRRDESAAPFWRGFWSLVAILVLASGSAVAQEDKPAQSGTPAAPAAAQAPADNTPAEYVGSETCQACHEDIFKAFRTNAHHVMEVEKSRKWDGKACEACHGPGSKHAESGEAQFIRNPAKLIPRESERVCLQCHANQPTNVGRIQSGHGRSGVACVSCHSIHKPPAEGITKGRVARVNALCASCHQATWAQFQKPYRHRLPESAMSCVDCHNPHGSLLPNSIQTFNANEPGCFRCHGDKRGPFTFDHAPVRLDGCSACHEPHGSANPRMLVRHEERFVCLECHANIGLPGITASGTMGGVPPAFHDLRTSRFRSCSSCHVKIHGSNINKAFLR